MECQRIRLSAIEVPHQSEINGCCVSLSTAKYVTKVPVVDLAAENAMLMVRSYPCTSPPGHLQAQTPLRTLTFSDVEDVAAAIADAEETTLVTAQMKLLTALARTVTRRCALTDHALPLTLPPWNLFVGRNLVIVSAKPIRRFIPRPTEGANEWANIGARVWASIRSLHLNFATCSSTHLVTYGSVTQSESPSEEFFKRPFDTKEGVHASALCTNDLYLKEIPYCYCPTAYILGEGQGLTFVSHLRLFATCPGV